MNLFKKYRLVTDGKSFGIKSRFGFYKDFSHSAFWWRKNSMYFSDCWTTDKDFAEQVLRRLES